MPARDVLREAAFTAQVGARIDETALRDFLVRMGFVQSPTVMEPGDYAIRGGIIDVYPPGRSGSRCGLDLFGDVLDGARRFDPPSAPPKSWTWSSLAPVSEVILDEARSPGSGRTTAIEFGAAGTDDPLYEADQCGAQTSGAEHWLPFFHDKLETLFDYLPRGHRSAWMIK